jgi:hypothetical protein
VGGSGLVTSADFWVTLAAMKGSTWRVLAAAGIAVLVFAGVAVAANTGSFEDATGDSGTAPDVSAVAISSDATGLVTIKVTLANRDAFGAGDGVGVGIDADQNPDTGTVFYGAEYELDLEGTAPKFYRAAASGFYEAAPLPASFAASYSGGAVTVSFKPSELGVSTGFGVYAVGFDNSTLDSAPDIRSINYQLSSNTTPPALSPDHRAPVVEAIRSIGTHGKVAELYYFASDGRAETSDAIVVYKGKKVLKRINFHLTDTNPFLPYVARWKVPKKTKGKLRFCVTSMDRAGNKSKTSCAALTVR